MDISLIDADGPMRPGWGRVWQGSWIDDPRELREIVPAPVAIVSMNLRRKGDDYALIDHVSVETVLSVAIPDQPAGVLSVPVLLGVVDAGAALLAQGLNLYVHCKEGHSRSTYYIAALRMRVLGESADDALAAISAQRPESDPIVAFVLALHQLQPLPPSPPSPPSPGSPGLPAAESSVVPIPGGPVVATLPVAGNDDDALTHGTHGTHGFHGTQGGNVYFNDGSPEVTSGGDAPE